MKPLPLDYWSRKRTESLRKKPLKRTAIKGGVVKVRKVSLKREKELRVYEKVKAEFFKRVTVCQFPGCNETELDVHHSRGRCGKFLTDIDTFRGLCRFHHSHCEIHVIEAKEMGLSFNRLDK